MTLSPRNRPQLVFFILAAVSLACNTLVPQATAIPQPTTVPPTSPPLPTEAPTATEVLLPTEEEAEPTEETEATEVPLPDGDPLFADAFENNDNNWEEWSDSDGSLAVEDGELQIRVAVSDWFFWALPNVELSDIDLVVEGRVIEGDEANISYGVMCHYVDTENFYIFTVTADGFYSVGAYINDDYVDIVEWTEHSAIITGQATNTVRTVCSGATLELYVNDELLVSTEDDRLEGGTFALHTGTFDTSSDPIGVGFDNLAVYEPAP
jgi:hypothetical protein